MTSFSVTSATSAKPNKSLTSATTLDEGISHYDVCGRGGSLLKIKAFFPIYHSQKLQSAELRAAKSKGRLWAIMDPGDSTGQELGRKGIPGMCWEHQSGFPLPADTNINNLGHLEGLTQASPTFKSHKGLTTHHSSSPGGAGTSICNRVTPVGQGSKKLKITKHWQACDRCQRAWVRIRLKLAVLADYITSQNLS